MHLALAHIDALDHRIHVVEAVMEMTIPWSDQMLGLGQPEGHEQQPRLIDMVVIAVDNRDVD